MKYHVAVMDNKTINNILNHIKTVESRFSKYQISPYENIYVDDIVLMKEQSANIIGYFRVQDVLHFEFNKADDFIEIKNKYKDKIVASEAYWKSKETAKYGTLIVIKEAGCTTPFRFNRKNRLGWISNLDKFKTNIVSLSGEIASGKSYVADYFSEQKNAHVLTFSSMLKKELIKMNKEVNRKNLQEFGHKLFSEIGVEGFVDKLLENVNSKDNLLVIDGIRHKSALDYLRTKYNLLHIYIHADIKNRFERYKGNVTYNEFTNICNRDTEKEIMSLIKDSDIVIENKVLNNRVFNQTLNAICSIILNG